MENNALNMLQDDTIDFFITTNRLKKIISNKGINTIDLGLNLYLTPHILWECFSCEIDMTWCKILFFGEDPICAIDEIVQGKGYIKFSAWGKEFEVRKSELTNTFSIQTYTMGSSVGSNSPVDKTTAFFSNKISDWI